MCDINTTNDQDARIFLIFKTNIKRNKKNNFKITNH